MCRGRCRERVDNTETGLNTRKLFLFEQGLIGKKEVRNSKTRFQIDRAIVRPTFPKVGLKFSVNFQLPTRGEFSRRHQGIVIQKEWRSLQFRPVIPG
jgi:hypothetical protein